MKIWFWLLLGLMMLIVSCASGYYQQQPPGYQEGGNTYWNEVLYNQRTAPEQR